MVINNATSRSRRGELNGIATMLSSLARAAGPAACGALFAFSINGDHSFPFDYYFTFIFMALSMVVVSVVGWNLVNYDEGDSLGAATAAENYTEEDSALEE